MIIAGFMVFVIGVIFIISYPINRKKNARCSEQTQGTLSAIRERNNSKGSLKDMHVYSYSVDGTEYQLKTLDHSQEVDRVGDSCTIWYNPANPQDAQAFHGSDKYLKALLLIGIVLALLGIILICSGFVQQFIL